MKANRNVSSIIASVLLIVLILLAQNTYNNAIEYERAYTKMTNADQDIVSSIMSSMFLSTTIKDEPVGNKELHKLKEQAQQSMYLLVIFLFLSLFIYFYISRFIFSIYIHLASLVSLIYGVITPIFLIFVHQKIAITEITIEFDSNSIISSIGKLFEQDNYFVGIIILIASIIFPLAKTIFSLLFNMLKENNFLNIHKISHTLSSLSKWSMSDVFVLSIFLVYLSPRKGGNIETELEMGFYMFLSYVFLSLIISALNFSQDKTKISEVVVDETKVDKIKKPDNTNISETKPKEPVIKNTVAKSVKKNTTVKSVATKVAVNEPENNKPEVKINKQENSNNKPTPIKKVVKKPTTKKASKED